MHRQSIVQYVSSVEGCVPLRQAPLQLPARSGAALPARCTGRLRSGESLQAQLAEASLLRQPPLPHLVNVLGKGGAVYCRRERGWWWRRVGGGRQAAVSAGPHVSHEDCATRTKNFSDARPGTQRHNGPCQSL